MRIIVIMERVDMNETLENNLDLAYKENILDNHICFLSKHRGIKECLEYANFIHSDNTDYNIAFPLSKESIEKISREFTIYLPQWVQIDEQIKSQYKKTGSLTYMILDGGSENWAVNKQIIIKRADTLSAIEDFSIVQVKGFCETQEEFNEWYSWLREKNVKNLDDNTQNFYVAYENEKPVGVTLCVYHGNTAGIYAVATLPEHRNKGISATLIQRAVNDAISNNVTTITLQTSTDSYAHSFYKKLGFKDAFECGIFEAI